MRRHFTFLLGINIGLIVFFIVAFDYLRNPVSKVRKLLRNELPSTSGSLRLNRMDSQHKQQPNEHPGQRVTRLLPGRIDSQIARGVTNFKENKAYNEKANTHKGDTININKVNNAIQPKTDNKSGSKVKHTTTLLTNNNNENQDKHTIKLSTDTVRGSKENSTITHKTDNKNVSKDKHTTPPLKANAYGHKGNSATKTRNATQHKTAEKYAAPWNCSGCFHWTYHVVLDQKDVCVRRHGEQPIDLIFLIPSTHAGMAQRSAIRNTWASVSRNNTSNVRHVFFLGATKDARLMRASTNESRQFRDMVFMSFEDTYRNLTLKTLTSLRWLTETCAEARFFLKVDDDMWVNSGALLQRLNATGDRLKTALAGGCAMPSAVIRKPGNKWSATQEEYPAEFFPEYCSGTAYAGTVGVARAVVAVSRDVPFFFLEDAYVGLCLRQLHYPVLSLQGFHRDVPRAVSGDPCLVWSPGLVTAHRVPPGRLLEYWSSRHRCAGR